MSNFSFQPLSSQFILSSAYSLSLEESKFFLFGKGLILSQASPGFNVSSVQVFRKHRGKKEKLLITSNFSFFHSVLCQFGELSDIFIKYEIVVCKRCQFGRVQNLSFGKGLRQRERAKKGLALRLLQEMACFEVNKRCQYETSQRPALFVV